LAVTDPIVPTTLLLAVDLAGTFVVALSGAAAGVKHRLDLFGVLVLSFAAGNSGGIARDLMIGASPPAAISDWRYVAVSILAGLLSQGRRQNPTEAAEKSDGESRSPVVRSASTSGSVRYSDRFQHSPWMAAALKRHPRT
jgi:hypothetical protein